MSVLSVRRDVDDEADVCGSADDWRGRARTTAVSRSKGRRREKRQRRCKGEAQEKEQHFISGKGMGKRQSGGGSGAPELRRYVTGL